jgi:hypothetical protein
MTSQSRPTERDRALLALLSRAIAAHAGRAVRASDRVLAAQMLTMRGAPLAHLSIDELTGSNGYAVGFDAESMIG